MVKNTVDQARVSKLMGSSLRGCEEYHCEYGSRTEHIEDFGLPSDPILKEGDPGHACRDAECKT